MAFTTLAALKPGGMIRVAPAAISIVAMPPEEKMEIGAARSSGMSGSVSAASAIQSSRKGEFDPGLSMQTKRRIFGQSSSRAISGNHGTKAGFNAACGFVPRRAEPPGDEASQAFSARRTASAQRSTAVFASSSTLPMVMKPWICRSKQIWVARLPASVSRWE